MVLLNDWSARDIQQWEYVPLGPFNSKSFATTISPWIVTLDALEPFRIATAGAGAAAARVPAPRRRACVRHRAGSDAAAARRARGDARSRGPTSSYMYWTMAQQLAHHTVSGCNTRVGDLMGSGTISGPTEDSCGSLLELPGTARSR